MKRANTSTRSIRTRIFVRTSAAMVLVIFCMVFFMRMMMISRLRADRIEMSLMESESQLGKLDNYLMTLMVKTDSLFVNRDFLELVSAMPKDPVETTKNLTNLRNLMDVAIYSLRYPEVSIADYPGGQVYACLYSANDKTYIDGEFIRSYDEIRDESYVQELMTQRRMFSWNADMAPYIGAYIAFNRRLLEYDNLTDVGVLQIRVPLSKVQKILSAGKSDSAIACYYLDMNGNVLFSDGMRGPDLSDVPINECHVMDIPEMGGERLVSCVRSSLNACRLICVSSMDSIESSVDFVTPIMIGGGIGTVALCTVVLFFLSGSLLNGLKQLGEKTRRAAIAVDEYEKLGPIRDTSEIEDLDAAYEKMVHTINQLHEEESRYKDMITDVQIELTQEQFNPHLLYNTLSLVRDLSAHGESGEICRVLDNLIAFYRRVLNRGQIVTRIRDEIQMIQSYLNIVRQVYHMELDVRVEIDEAILDLCCVKLFLQPIVENSILHGMVEVGSGSLSIVGRREGEYLVFVVEDDGLGIEPEKLERVRASIANSGEESVENFGLVSISRRLRLFFGNDYTMKIESEAGEGTRVEIRIPPYGEDQISAQIRSKLV